MTRQAAQYLRMSTDRQNFSLEQQAAVIAAFAAREGYEIVRTYEDAGRSGVTATGRDGLKALLRDVVFDPPYDTVLVLDVSRWGRYQDPDEAAHYEFIFRQAGVRVRYCAEAFDDDGSMASGIVKTLKRMMAAEYSRQLSERSKAGLSRAARSGNRVGGHATYGFARASVDSESGELTLLDPGVRKSRPDDRVVTVLGPPDRVRIVREIFAMCVNEVRGPGEIAKILNMRGVAYDRPGPWNHNRVGRVLKNELVTGVQVFNRSRCRFGERRVLDRSHWTRTAIMKPIVSRSTFEAAQRRLASRRNMNHTDEELLAGLKRIVANHGDLSKPLIEAHAYASYSVHETRFGSIAKMRAAVGYEPTARNGYHVWRGEITRERVVEGLRRLLSEKGSLSQHLINATPWLPNVSTMRNRFGSLEDLYREVGFVVRRGRPTIYHVGRGSTGCR